MKGYVIGSDNEVYKLPYTSKNRTYQLRKLIVVQMPTGTKGYWFFQGKDKYWWSLLQLKRMQDMGELEPIDEEMILVADLDSYPFGK